MASPSASKSKPRDGELLPPFASEGEEARRSARALVQAERQSRRALEQTMADVEAKLIADLQQIDEVSPDDAQLKAQAAAKRSAERLEAAAVAVLVAIWARGRAAAAERVDQQMSALQRLLHGGGVPISKEAFRVERAESTGDAARAAAVGKSLASAWHLQIAMAIPQRTTKEAMVATKTAGRHMQKRATRAAVTETAAAFSTETGAELEQLLLNAKQRHLPLQALLFKRWESMLDRRVCPTCANHDNEVVPIDKPFRGGDVPGMVHPLCRCMAMPAAYEADLSLAAAVTREIAGPGVGRRALGTTGRAVYDNVDDLPEDARRKWLEMFARAKQDEEYRARLFGHELRRHTESTLAGEERHAEVVPRLRAANTRARGVHTDQRAPRTIHEEAMGRQAGAPYGHIEYGQVEATTKPSYQDWRRQRGWRSGPDPLTETRKARKPRKP